MADKSRLTRADFSVLTRPGEVVLFIRCDDHSVAEMIAKRLAEGRFAMRVAPDHSVDFDLSCDGLRWPDND